MHPESHRAPAVLERLGLVVGLALAAALMWPVRGYLTDDTFIHLQYARNLAHGDGLVFNLGERVYGCTSPLWVGLIAAGMRIGLDGLVVARVLGALCTLISVALFYRLMRHALVTPALVALGTVTWAGHAWMLRWSLSGMETPLAVVLTLAGFTALTGVSRPRPFLAMVMWAFAALTRPEAALLLVLGSTFLAVDVARGSAPRRALAAAVLGLAIYGAWLVLAWQYFGTAWPQTLAAKTAGGGGPAAWIMSLTRQAEIVAATDGVLGVVLVVALLIGPRTRAATPAATHLLPVAWVALLPALYALRGVQVLSRYLVVVLPVLEWLAWQAAERWWLRESSAVRNRRPARWAVAVGALALIQNLLVYRLVVMPQVTSFTAGLEQSLIPWGTWFSNHAPAGAAIATPDIGAIGYFSRRPVLDLGGLVTPEMIPLLEREPFEDAVANFHFAAFARPLFVIDRAATAFDLQRRSPFAACLEPLGTATVPNLGVTRPGAVIYSFYRVNWRTYEQLAGALR